MARNVYNFKVIESRNSGLRKGETFNGKAPLASAMHANQKDGPMTVGVVDLHSGRHFVMRLSGRMYTLFETTLNQDGKLNDPVITRGRTQFRIVRGMDSGLRKGTVFEGARPLTREMPKYTHCIAEDLVHGDTVEFYRRGSTWGATPVIG